VACIFDLEGDAKSPFPPLSPSQVAERLQDVIAQSPRNFQREQSRWTLASLQQCCQEWIGVATPAGVWKLLHRFALRYKRARLYVHSPDLAYAHKRQRIAAIEAQVRADPQRLVLLYLDECTYSRAPTLANAYVPSGHCQARAALGYRANYEYRILAALDAVSGQVHYQQRNHIRRNNLVAFWQQLRQAYPQAEVIYVVLDNWPVHYHADSLACLQPQPFAADFIQPGNWPTQPTLTPASPPLPIVLLPLPTYASWLNPIEKLWRFLRQTVTHLHPFEDDSDALKAAVAAFLDRFALGSHALLHYTGLLPY
jgi:hypothetical protein